MRTSAPNTPLGITFHQIDKRYGSLFALRRVSLEIRAGEVVAFVGANGSGKSTLLRVAGLLSRPTAGRVYFPGAPSNLLELRRHIAMVGHATMLYEELTAEENLALFAQLYDLPDRGARIGEALESAGLATRRRSLVRTFSRGRGHASNPCREGELNESGPRRTHHFRQGAAHRIPRTRVADHNDCVCPSCARSL